MTTDLLGPIADEELEQPVDPACSQLGIPIHQCDMAKAIERIGEFVEIGRSTGRSHQVVTVNADFLVTARREADVHAILRGADLSLADGMPIVWASSALGVRLPERVAGADLVPALAESAIVRGHKIMLFGGLAGSAKTSADVLRSENPGLLVESLECPVGPKGETEERDLEQIRAFAPDIICVALGHPKQERWIRLHAEALGIPVAVGVGGTLDFIAGQRKRAPGWVRTIGFEWLFRMLQEPQRLTRRYLGGFTVFVPAIAQQITLMGFGDQFRRTVARVDCAPYATPAISLSSGRIGRETVEELTDAASPLRSLGATPTMALSSYRQSRALTREGLDRLFHFVPQDQPISS